MSLLKKNSASLKRQSSQFEPMRKPDILKLRRESLSKIMLSRKTEESRRQLLKGTVSREFISWKLKSFSLIIFWRFHFHHLQR
jgi:hypothetical protein